MTAFHQAIVKAKSWTVFAETGGEEGSFCSEVIRYYNNSSKLYNVTHLQKPRMVKWDDVDYQWIQGPSGVGKTYWAYDNFEFTDVYKKNSRTKWWDGYNAETCIVIDEYRRNEHLDYQDLLSVLDVYPHMVEVKNGTVHLNSNSTTIVVTSNFWPWDIFAQEEINPAHQQPGDLCTPLVRRCHLWQMDASGRRVLQDKPAHPVRPQAELDVIELSDDDDFIEN